MNKKPERPDCVNCVTYASCIHKLHGLRKDYLENNGLDDDHMKESEYLKYMMDMVKVLSICKLFKQFFHYIIEHDSEHGVVMGDIFINTFKLKPLVVVERTKK